MKATSYNSKKTIARRTGSIYAAESIKGFNQQSRVTGLTNGQFSLISLIDTVLDITGKADVTISTWSAGVYDVGAIAQLIESNKIGDFRIILDRSFKTRQSGYAVTVEQLFRLENIRTTNTHSKFVLIKNDEWNICIRSSMNLNENKRCENFDIDNDIDVFNLFNDFAEELFEIQPAGIIESRGVVDKTFDKLFDDSEFKIDMNFDFKFGD